MAEGFSWELIWRELTQCIFQPIAFHTQNTSRGRGLHGKLLNFPLNPPPQSSIMTFQGNASHCLKHFRSNCTQMLSFVGPQHLLFPPSLKLNSLGRWKEKVCMCVKHKIERKMTSYEAPLPFSNIHPTPIHSITWKILTCGIKELNKGGEHTEVGP